MITKKRKKKRDIIMYPPIIHHPSSIKRTSSTQPIITQILQEPLTQRDSKGGQEERSVVDGEILETGGTRACGIDKVESYCRGVCAQSWFWLVGIFFIDKRNIGTVVQTSTMKRYLDDLNGSVVSDLDR